MRDVNCYGGPMTRRRTVSDIEESRDTIRREFFGQWVNQLVWNINLGLLREVMREKRPRRTPITHEKKYCHVTKKRAYTENGARWALSNAVGQSGEIPVRMYLCDHCSMHHLSSRMWTQL